MVSIQPQSFAIGTVFPYIHAFSETSVNDHLEENEFSLIDRNQQGISITPQGIGFGPNPIYAEKGSLRVLLNQDADLEGLADSSFITFKDPTGEHLDDVLDAVDTFWGEYTDINVGDERIFVELTYEGYIRVERDNHALTRLVNRESVSPLNELSETDSKTTAIHFQADQSGDQSGWYRLQFDSEAIGNPRLWAFKIVRRNSTYKEIDIDTVNNSIKAIVENTAKV